MGSGEGEFKENINTVKFGKNPDRIKTNSKLNLLKQLSHKRKQGTPI